MTPFSPMTLPVIGSVDVLVVGASSGAVATALEVQRMGRRAMVVSELSYLGEESAGMFSLWPEGIDRVDPLVHAIFPDGGLTPVLPCAVKGALDAALVQASVPFLYLSRPIAVLRDEIGRVAGAILAARTSLVVVRCRTIVDATRYGVVARLAGLPLTMRTELPATIAWTIIANERPADWQGEIEEIDPAFRQQLKDGAATFSAYRLQKARAALGDAPLAYEHMMRSGLVSADVLATADIISDVPAERCVAARLYDHPTGLPESDLTPTTDVMLLNGLLPLTLSGCTALARCDVQVALGRRVGRLAVESVSDLRKPGVDLVAQTGGAEDGDFRFAPAFLRRDEGQVMIEHFAVPSLGRCDVLVAGGGTGGAPAGIAAAREGATTVVLEPQHALGGVSTLGLISTYWFGNRVGFTAELDDAVMAVDPASRELHGNKWSPDVKASVYHRLLQEAGGAAWLGCFAVGVRMDGERVDGVLVSTPYGCGVLAAGCVVDATGNADIAAAAGAPCRVIDARHVATQGTGLSPRVYPGVWDQNSDHTFVDETDPAGITEAFVNARAKFAGDFDVSSLVNTRERRQILGDYEVSPPDILAERTFPDTLVTARSNFDTHGFIVHPLFMVAAPDHAPLQAHVPFRCMLPQGVDGVLVTGLGMSAHRDALPVLRMQADVQNQGFAAGIAAATVAANSLRVRDIDIRALQRHLVALGILAPDVPTHVDSFPLSADSVRAAADGALATLMPAAILLAHPTQSRPLLLAILQEDADVTRRLDAAVILGLMGCPEAATVLSEAVQARVWDEGWNYRGMGQFGQSMSRLDAMLLALARTGDPQAIPVLAEKIRQLDGDAQFSHCRVAGLATALLRDVSLAIALANLLRLPGMQGHAQLELSSVIRTANGDPTETTARNLALREIYLARGLYLAGDVDGLGRAILERYTGDLRGHLARHARAVLESGGDAVGVELA
jgi:hypothetical protein